MFMCLKNGFAKSKVQNWDPANNYFLKLQSSVWDHRSFTCVKISKWIFIVLQAPNDVEIEMFIFAPANSYSIINDQLHSRYICFCYFSAKTSPAKNLFIPVQGSVSTKLHSVVHQRSLFI